MPFGKRFAIHRCKGCGADQFTSYEEMAAHLIDCDQIEPKFREMARAWLAELRAARPPAAEGEGRGG